MGEQYLVCFIDILGYSNLVGKYIAFQNVVELFEEAMHQTTVGMANLLGCAKHPGFSDKDNDDFNRKIGNIKVRFIFDNIIFSLPIPEDAIKYKRFIVVGNVDNNDLREKPVIKLSYTSDVAAFFFLLSLCSTLIPAGQFPAACGVRLELLRKYPAACGGDVY